MTPEYESYLKSDEWKRKREQRLAISGGRCSACGIGVGVEVHHLTYERIFNEDMADLLPLCVPHHEYIERMIQKGAFRRTGNPLFLATETIRVLLHGGIRKGSKFTPKVIALKAAKKEAKRIRRSARKQTFKV